MLIKCAVISQELFLPFEDLEFSGIDSEVVEVTLVSDQVYVQLVLDGSDSFDYGFILLF